MGTVTLIESVAGIPSTQLGTNGAAHIVAPSEIPATLTQTHISDISTTRQYIPLPSGAKWVHISYRLLPGATATANQFLKVVPNATSDADADGKLATANAHIELYQGDDLLLTFADDNLCERLDMLTAQVVGSEKTKVRILSGVA